MIDPLEIELASYASWVALEQVNYQGWLLRYANGATKRANSVNVISPGFERLDEAIVHCESFFAARSQPTIFRLLSFIENRRLDTKLANLGYSFVDPSLVLYQKIASSWNEANPVGSCDRASWLKTYCDISDINLESQITHAKILAKIPNSSLFAILEDQDRPVACGLGVIHKEYFGIFDLITRKQDRNKGYGTNLIKGMIAWARNQGIQHFYLQVTAHNASAIRLYEKLGYRYLYHYWYRIQRTRL